MTDYNVDNYTIAELYRIIDKTTEDSLDDIREKIGEYKNKFDSESRPELSNFMTNILNAITLDRTTKNVDNENKQKKRKK